MIESNGINSIYFFDESRFGTHSKLGHGWFKKGKRTNVPIKLGFENFYIYSAISPSTGNDFTLVIPHVNTDCMNAFLEEMSNYLHRSQATIIMDRASWHKSKKLIIPNNIKIVYLPPYSPELNPVERLWLYLKANIIRNKVYETIETLKDSVCTFIAQLTNEFLRSMCSINY